MGGIDTARTIPFAALRNAPARKRLWLGAGAAALFLATLAGCAWAQSLGRPHAADASNTVGLDFIAFYTAGTFVREGRADDLYNLRSVQAFQHDLAARHGVDLGNAFGPWWNPPFYAWVFEPLSRLSFPAATRVWIGFNLACAATAAWLLARLLPRGGGWRTWALVPVGMFLSTPFIHCLTHAQNTCTSLLILTLTVTAWRAGRATTAGLIAGLLFYKPQLAAVFAAALVVSLGWRAALGLIVTGSLLLLVTLTTLPGSLGHFLHQMPANIHAVQTRCVYNWERHVTFKAFWRLLLQGTKPGETSRWASGLCALCVAAVAVSLVRVSPLGRWINPFARGADDTTPAGRDRFIAATIAATPLLMPFYFDYDLLLLTVPAVLFAAEMMRRDRRTPLTAGDRWLMAAWPALYGWLLLNADVAEHLRLNLAVPLLAVVASLLTGRVRRREVSIAAEAPHTPVFSKAA